MVRPLLSLALLVLTMAIPLNAQATRLVDPLDAVYQDLEVLADEGLIERLNLARRPLSRAEISRLASIASRTLAQRTSAQSGVVGRGGDSEASPSRTLFLQQLLTSLRARLDLRDTTGSDGQSVRVALLQALTFDVTRTDEPTERIPETNGLGFIDAQLNTLLVNRQGLPLGQGTNTSIESTHTLESPHVVLSVSPLLYSIAPVVGERKVNLTIQELQLRFLFRNLALDVGREYLVWGQGRNVGLLNSTNSPPLDLIKLSSESPFSLPWFFRHLGPTRAAIFYADLGARQNFPHAYLVGYGANIAPSDWANFGVSVYTKSGGRGAPPATLTARLIDLLPFLDASAYNNLFGTRGKFTFSDHYAGLDGRLRFGDGLGSLYWELLMNDFDIRRLSSVLWEDAGHVFGLQLPRFLASRLGSSLEYHHTGVRYYEHDQFTSGQTLRETLTGDPLGPNAQGLYANVEWYASPFQRIELQLAADRRSNDEYIGVPEPNFGFERTVIRPKERQRRITAAWRLLPPRASLDVLVQLGYAQTSNFGFSDGVNRSGFLARSSVEYRFH